MPRQPRTESGTGILTMLTFVTTRQCSSELGIVLAAPKVPCDDARHQPNTLDRMRLRYDDEGNACGRKRHGVLHRTAEIYTPKSRQGGYSRKG